MIKNLFKLLLIMLLFIGLSACSGIEIKSATQYDYRAQHPITVNQQTASLIFDLKQTIGHLRPDELKEVKAFAKNYLIRGHGPISISLPSNFAQTNFIDQLEQALIYEGVVPESIKYLPFPQNVEIIAMTHRQYIARASACIHRQSTREKNKLGAQNFGCAYMNNLAMQLKDPYDLVSPMTSGYSDAVARQRVIENFRSGKSTKSGVAAAIKGLPTN